MIEFIDVFDKENVELKCGYVYVNGKYVGIYKLFI